MLWGTRNRLGKIWFWNPTYCLCLPGHPEVALVVVRRILAKGELTVTN